VALHYLVKCQCLKSNNKTTSVTTHFKKVTTGNNVFTVNTFSVVVYYLTSVQDASVTPGPCSRTAHRHTLLGTH